MALPSPLSRPSVASDLAFRQENRPLFGIQSIVFKNLRWATKKFIKILAFFFPDFIGVV